MAYRLPNSRGAYGSAGNLKVYSRTQMNSEQQVVVMQGQGPAPPSLSKVAPTFQGSLGQPRVKKPSTTKFVRTPKSCGRRLRDAYVSFMMSMAAKSTFNMTTVAYTTWPCAGVPSRYPGRSRRTEMSDEEIACSSIALKTPNATTGMQIMGRPPPCARKAVFPLQDQTHRDLE